MCLHTVSLRANKNIGDRAKCHFSITDSPSNSFSFLLRGFIVEHLSARVNGLVRRCIVILMRVRTRVRLALRIRKFKCLINGDRIYEIYSNEIVAYITNNLALSRFERLCRRALLISSVHAGDSI